MERIPRRLDRRAALLWAVAAALTVTAWGGSAATIRGSKHDLSVGGEGPVTALSEQQVCVFCHVPHRAFEAKPLANRRTSGATYLTYSSTTAWSIPPQPGGVSTLCLSCHDGTVALGDLWTKTVSMANTAPGGFIPDGPSSLGTDLRGAHPISMAVPLNKGTVQAPPPGDPVRLDAAGRVQCTSCHDPHDPEWVPFLVKSQCDFSGTYGGALCLSCHRPDGWPASAHAQAVEVPAPEEFSAPGGDQSTVAQLACSGCHRVHHADEPPRLGRSTPEGRCLACHSGHPAPDISAMLSLPFRHPVGQGVHDPTENLQSQPPSARHAECADCHDPHAALREPKSAGPAAPGSLSGVGGLSVQYVGGPWSEPAAVPTAKVTWEYQLCFKCHSGWSYGLTPPASPSRKAADGVSAPGQTSPALAFNPLNPGLHAVVGPHPRSATGAPGAFRGADRSGTPWSWESVLLCTDCHGAAPDCPGPAGPHGSSESFILRGAWVHAPASGQSVQPATGTAGTRDHLCFSCHDPALYLDGLGNNTGFRSGSFGHSLHGAPHHQVACTACHAGVPHGYHNQAMLVETTDPYPFNAGSRLTFPRDGFGNPVLPPSGAWTKTDCQTACHSGP